MRSESSLLAQRELNDAVRAALGTDLFSNGSDAGLTSFLPPAKRDALRRIQQDYDEMMAKFSPNGIQLASDKERLALLRAERDRDIAALLTPAERAEYELRTSSTSLALRARLGDAIQYQELRALDGLATRLNLPAGTTERVAATRDALATESQKINADNSLPVTERRARLQELANRARTELTQTLGAEAADAYAQRAAWLSLLQNGVAFATTPKDSPVQVGLGGSSVYPVLPAGVTSNMRQSVNISSSSGFLSAPGSGTTGFIVAPAGQATPSTNTMQVISVTTSSQGGTTTTTTTTSGTPPPRQ